MLSGLKAMNRLETLCRAGIDKWGEQAQLLMMVEECAELQHAILSTIRGREGAWGQVIEELADVELMCVQMRCILGPALCEAVDQVKEQKLDRLEQRFKKETEQ